jgi:hypothetical protein
MNWRLCADVTSCAVSPSAQILYTAGVDGAVLRWRPNFPSRVPVEAMFKPQLTHSGVVRRFGVDEDDATADVVVHWGSDSDMSD